MNKTQCRKYYSKIRPNALKKKGVDFGMYPLGKKNLHFITLMYCVFLRAYSVYYGSIEMALLLCMYILP